MAVVLDNTPLFLILILVKKDEKMWGLMAGEAQFSREMAAARGLIGDPAQARRDSPDPGRRHDGRGHPAAIFGRRAGRAAA